MDLTAWLLDLGLERYAAALAAHHVDAEVLPKLTAEDLIAIGITSVGHRRKLLEAIAQLRGRAGAARPASAPDAPANALPETRRSAAAERRQLTVLFCDLVGSTALAGQLDPEDMGALIRTYHEGCTEVVRRWDGHVARFLGDGVLAYFGWPRAHEDDAERAVRAGLALVETVCGLDGYLEAHLKARVGIATGLVVVGDLIGEGATREAAVVGETPNLAARLQGLADPGTVVVAASTRRLLGGLFALTDLGPQRLKGFREPLAAFRVEGEGRAEGRFEALRGESLTPLVGREHELAVLLERFAWAREGDGQVVLIAGEAGIGKSRLLRALRQRLVGTPHVTLSHFCSPYHTNSALHPVTTQLERAAGFTAEDQADDKRAKLAALLARATEQVDEAMPLVGALLGVSCDPREPAPSLSPQGQKQRTFEVLIDQLAGLARAQPVLELYEDLHWADPSTLELLDLMVERVRRLPALVVLTYRPEFSPAWIGRGHVTAQNLNRLDRRQGAAMVERLAGGKPLPAEILEQIVARTDGVPLFVEELTKAVLESGLLQDQGDRYELTGPLPPLAIPATLHDSLMARLDRLAPTKETAQTGAVIGREFSYELLRSVSRLTERELGRALADLIASGLILRRGTPPDANFVFKHALVQEAAYGSLLRDRRRHFHARIATVLEERSVDTVEQRPELIAHHFDEAGFFDQAAAYWLKAGQRAAQRSANIEAITHLTRCVEALHRLPDTPQRARCELTCQLALGPALLATKGWSALEAASAYLRARDLCEGLGDDRERFNALWGLWQFRSSRGETEVAFELINELWQIAERLDDPALRLQAHHAAWADINWLGDPLAAYEHVKRGLAIYNSDAHRNHALLYGGHDPGVCGRGQGALSLWMLGYPNRARHSARAAVELAEDLGHVPSLAHALFWSAFCYQFRREGPAAFTCSQRLFKLASEQGLKLYSAGAQIIRGWALATKGKVRQGLTEQHRGLEAYAAIEIKMLSSYFKATLAESFHRAGQTESAMMTIDDALRLADQTGEHFWQAAMLHLKGEIFLSLDPPDQTQSEVSFRAAIDLARKQKSRSLELRAATSLARLRAEQGRRAEARELLAPVYDRFTEGFDTPDLKDAEAILDGLR